MSAATTSGKAHDYRVAFNWVASQTPPMQLVVSAIPPVGSKVV